MKVRDLIKELSTMDQDAPVVTAGMDESGFAVPVVSTVKLQKLRSASLATGAVWDAPSDDAEGEVFTAVSIDLNCHDD